VCSVGSAIVLELFVKLLRMVHVAWSPVTVLGALAFIVAVANVVYQPSYHATLDRHSLFIYLFI